MINKIHLVISKSIYIKLALKFILFQLRFIIFYFSKNKNFDKKISKILVCEVEGFTGYFGKSIFNSTEDTLIYHREKKGNCDIYALNISNLCSRKLATTNAWNYQQGAMTEFISDDCIIFNKFINKSLAAVILNIKNNKEKIIELYPIQTIIPNRGAYISLNYNRLTNLRKDYGYSRLSKSHLSLNNQEDGLWYVSFKGFSEIIVTISLLHELESIPQSYRSKVNHVMASKCGKYLLFLFRYFKREQKISCLYSFNLENRSLTRLMRGVISHYCWLRDDKYVVWYRDVRGGVLEVRSVTDVDYVISNLSISDGHPVVGKNGDVWFDSYPNVLNKIFVRRFRKGNFLNVDVFSIFCRPQVKTKDRCDAHPKVSRRYLVLDLFRSTKRTFGVFNLEDE